jgi:hypothetical protein
MYVAFHSDPDWVRIRAFVSRQIANSVLKFLSYRQFLLESGLPRGYGGAENSNSDRFDDG